MIINLFPGQLKTEIPGHSDRIFHHACINCAARALCTKNKKGRVIERSEYAPYMEKNRGNIEAGPQTYKKRQSIVEHPYGTIKRQWGFYYIITKKGLKRASADVGFMFVAYNLRRLMNIIDKKQLTRFLKELVSLFFQKTGLLKAIKSLLRPPNFINHLLKINYDPAYNCIKFNYI